jgi:hypothetical protein
MHCKGINAPQPNMKKFAKKMNKYGRIPKKGGSYAGKSKKKN